MNKKFAPLLILLFLLQTSCSDTTQTAIDKDNSAPSATPKPMVTNLPQVQEEKQGRNHTEQPLVGAELAKIDTISADYALPTKMMHRESVAGSTAVGQTYHYLPPPINRAGTWNRESYEATQENQFINSLNDPLSTFSIDVDTASYANVRRFILGGSLPPGGAVRTEEMINYFNYSDPTPGNSKPFSLKAEVGPSPFHNDYKIVRVSLNSQELPTAQLPPSNLVFLIDVSGSMNQPNKLPLLKQSLKLLVGQLSSQDRVAIVVYAGSDRVVMLPTPGNEHDTITQAIDNLRSGGSTHASKGIQTAYELAGRVYMPGGNNRVILVSDGDFNVGITSRSELQTLIEDKRKSGIYLTVLGFGGGNYHDDTMEILADKGNGNYAYIDSLLEAKKVLIKERSGTLFTLANDVKIQVEFNPKLVGAYRLIGYENRALEDEDFRNDKKDAGEIGAGHHVTALYEIIPAGHTDIPDVDQLKYQRTTTKPALHNRELLTVKLRYKPRGSHASTQISTTVSDSNRPLDTTSSDFRFAASVAGFAMLLKDSEYLGNFSWDDCLNLAKGAKGTDEQGYRAEFARLIEMGQLLKENG